MFDSCRILVFTHWNISLLRGDVQRYLNNVFDLHAQRRGVRFGVSGKALEIYTLGDLCREGGPDFTWVHSGGYHQRRRMGSAFDGLCLSKRGQERPG